VTSLTDDDRDWWHLASIALLVLIGAADIGVPGKVIAALVSAGERVASGDVTPEQIVAGLPSVAWPVACVIVGLAVCGIAAWRMWTEGQVEGRWLWVLASAGLTVLWSCATIALVIKAHQSLARAAAGL
jgi:hypothetical protein